MEKLMNSFINRTANGFLEYFDEYKQKKLMNREDYKNLYNQINEIFDKYKNVQSFIEDEQMIDLTEEEKKMALSVLDLHEDIATLELIEAFKLGEKEMINFLLEMDMIKKKKE